MVTAPCDLEQVTERLFVLIVLSRIMAAASFRPSLLTGQPQSSRQLRPARWTAPPEAVWWLSGWGCHATLTGLGPVFGSTSAAVLVRRPVTKANPAANAAAVPRPKLNRAAM